MEKKIKNSSIHGEYHTFLRRRRASGGSGRHQHQHQHQHQQYYVSREDGTVVYAFEAAGGGRSSKRGRSHDELQSIT